MGFRLIIEVLDHAPAELTPAELLVLVAIARDADDTTREAEPGMRRLARITRLEPDSVRRVLQRLRDRKLELRQPVGIDGRGQPVVAWNGHRTSYKLPFFMADRRDEDPAIAAGKAGRGPRQKAGRRDGDPANRPSSGDEDPGSPAEGGTRIPATGRIGGMTVPANDARRRDEDPAAPYQQQDLLLLQQERLIQIVQAHIDVDDGEASAIIELVRRDKRPVNLGGLLTTMGREGDLPGYLARVRKLTPGPSDRAQLLERLERLPACEHGYAGGHEVAPDGWIRCPIERKRHSRGVP